VQSRFEILARDSPVGARASGQSIARLVSGRRSPRFQKRNSVIALTVGLKLASPKRTIPLTISRIRKVASHRIVTVSQYLTSGYETILS
jgi:hypothetical protein